MYMLEIRHVDIISDYLTVVNKIQDCLQDTESKGAQWQGKSQLVGNLIRTLLLRFCFPSQFLQEVMPGPDARH